MDREVIKKEINSRREEDRVFLIMNRESLIFNFFIKEKTRKKEREDESGIGA
jgi:hypothetical protein